MGIHAEIMRTALDKYLSSEEQWCVGAQARQADHTPLSGAISPFAHSYCAEGAITAASHHVRDLIELGWWGLAREVMCGVERILVEQNPKIVAALRRQAGAGVGDGFSRGHSLPYFNDGTITEVTTVTDGVLECQYREIPGVGYQGIRDAFEKYLVECEERDV